jgi:hypothetical protein
LIQDIITVPAANQWSSIVLHQWINRVGHYSISLTAPGEEWSQTFEVQSPYQVTANEVSNLPTVQVTDSHGIPITLPLTVAQSHQFWSTTLLITGLWTLEQIKLLLSDDQSQISRTVQANASGHLRLELSTFHDLLPSSKQYFLDYQRLGQTAQRLVQLVEDLPLSWAWCNHSLELTGLKADQSYSISCWNLLTPQSPSIEISIPSTTSATVPLDLPPGIYYLQLEFSNQFIEALGWWCSSNQYDLPIETEDNEALANYCYTILDNALIHEFQAATTTFSLDAKWIETIATSLGMGNYHFPDWLNTEALLAKLRSILVPLYGQWYKICTVEGKRGDFRDALMSTIAENNLWHLILDFRRHRQRDERNIVFVNLTDIEMVRPYLNRIPYFEWISRSPLSPQEVEVLLENGDVE